MKIGALLSLCIGTLRGNILWRSLLHGVAFLTRSCSGVQSPLVSSVCGTHPVEKKDRIVRHVALILYRTALTIYIYTMDENWFHLKG